MKITLLGENVDDSKSPAVWEEINPGIEFNVRSIQPCEFFEIASQTKEGVLNITAPLKQIAHQWCKRVGQSDGGFFGSINYIQFVHERPCGFSTDGEAVCKTLEEFGKSPADSKILVLGTGGAARAILGFMLAWVEPKWLHFYGRNKLEVEEIFDCGMFFLNRYQGGDTYFNKAEEVSTGPYDIIINATSFEEIIRADDKQVFSLNYKNGSAFGERVLWNQARIANGELLTRK